LQAATAALAAGELVIIYPEGTCTRDPNGWPMAGKTGVARLVLGCDVPVIPVAHWGAHRIVGYRSKRVNLLGRKPVHAIAGPPIDLSRYRGLEPTSDVLREVTDLLMSRVKQLLGELRDETPPTGFFAPPGRESVPESRSAADGVQPEGSVSSDGSVSTNGGAEGIA
jgi:1-acyl-sn-glycerol-3-phosphate acyltransferase